VGEDRRKRSRKERRREVDQSRSLIGLSARWMRRTRRVEMRGYTASRTPNQQPAARTAEQLLPCPALPYPPLPCCWLRPGMDWGLYCRGRGLYCFHRDVAASHCALDETPPSAVPRPPAKRKGGAWPIHAGALFCMARRQAGQHPLANGFRIPAQTLQTWAAPETKIPELPYCSLYHIVAGGWALNSTAWILTAKGA
jgi:hypothetical protein